ncbi:MAG: hypothetical protein U0229_04455 [Anaeromyxobacter sp.]
MQGPETFRLRADAMQGMARRLNLRFLLTVGAVALIVVALFSAGLRDQEGGYRALAVGLVILAVFAYWGWRRRLTRFRERWASFTIVLEPDALVRTVVGYPETRIPRAEVASVGEAPAGVVVRAKGGQAIVVPRELDGYDRLRAAVASWKTEG